MYAVRFKTVDTIYIEIPTVDYIHDKGGIVNYPQTGMGFTSVKNGSIIPEYDANIDLKIKYGAEIYKIVGNEETLIAVYNCDHKKIVEVIDK